MLSFVKSSYVVLSCYAIPSYVYVIMYFVMLCGIALHCVVSCNIILCYVDQ